MACKECQKINEVQDLTSPYIIFKCKNCNREINTRIFSNDGHSFKVSEGSTLIFPKGWLKLAANPLKGTGKLYKPGLDFFAKLTFVEELPKRENEIEEVIEENFKISNAILDNSKLIKGLDFEDPEEAEEIHKRLSSNQSTVEWWAYLFGNFNNFALEAIKEGESQQAAWAMGCAERFRSMIVFKQHFEDVVWMGHSAKRIVDVLRKWHANKKNAKESYWQKVFKDNPYVLSQIFSVPVIFIKDNAYVGGMNVDKKDAKFVDYLYASESSNDVILVEIKTPCTKLLGSKYRSIYRPSAELSGSIVQVLDYRRELARNIKNITDGTSHELEVFNPKCILIAGNSEDELTDENQRDSFEIYRSNLREVEIVTYDELFKKAETLATLFNLKPRE